MKKKTKEIILQSAVIVLVLIVASAFGVAFTVFVQADPEERALIRPMAPDEVARYYGSDSIDALTSEVRQLRIELMQQDTGK